MFGRFLVCFLAVYVTTAYGAAVSAQGLPAGYQADIACSQPVPSGDACYAAGRGVPRCCRLCSAAGGCQTACAATCAAGSIADGRQTYCEPGLFDACFGTDCCPGNGFFVDGWLAQGFTVNPDDPANSFNGPLTFNDRANEYQMNQLYVRLGRAVDTSSCCWDVGGQVDLLYGTDYFFTTALGLETEQDGSPRWNSDDGPRGAGAAMYGLAMPQAYAEVFAPFRHGLSVKIGHFYTILGYERVPAPENFFYSHAYTMQYGEPFTHTGLLGSYSCSPCLTVYAGLTRGWDTWEDPNDALGFLGGFTWESPSRATSLGLTFHVGNEDPAGDNNRTVYSLVFMRRLTRRLRYVFQHDFGTEELASINSNFRFDDAKWYGINQYLFYALNARTDLGLRVEWFRDEDNARVLGIPIDPLVNGGNYVAFTFGMNWKPRPYVILRPEVRWDWSDVDAPLLGLLGMYNDFEEESQLTLALDLITRF